MTNKNCKKKKIDDSTTYKCVSFLFALRESQIKFYVYTHIHINIRRRLCFSIVQIFGEAIEKRKLSDEEFANIT